MFANYIVLNTVENRTKSMFYTSTPGDGRSAILKIVNIIMNKSFTLDDVDFSLPTINSDITKNRNSKVSVVFRNVTGFVGSKTIYYNRIHIGALPTLTVARGSATTYHGLIPVLNSVFNLRLSPSDIENGPLPDQVSENITITLPITDDSYLYYDTSEINTTDITPVYSIFKPSHTLLSYFCNSFDRYGEYSDNEGGQYTKLVQTNSYECGYEDGSTRITLIPPAVMSVLEEDISDVFTLNLTNSEVSTIVTVTVSSPGLNISQTSFVLDQINDVETFTVNSNNPGTYEITVSNNQSLVNPLPVYFTVIDRYNTTYNLVDNPVLESFETVPSQEFTIQGYNIDPDESVTVNILTSAGLTPSVPSVVLTSADMSATFTVSGVNDGTYTINFTNNRGLTNPGQLLFVVRPNISLMLSPPTEPVLEDRQSDLFTVTLQSGEGPVTVTPVAIGAASIVPTSFIVTPGAPTGSFRVTYADIGPYTISLTNDSDVINPADYDFTVLVQPTIVVTPPVADIYSGVSSDAFTVELFNGYKPVTVTITSNVDALSTTSIELTPAEPTATFTLMDSLQGNYFVDFANDQSYAISDQIDFTILRTLVPEVTLASPGVLNLEVGETSTNFTVSLVDHNGPVVVTIATNSGLESSETSVILDSLNPAETFTVTAIGVGAKTVTITNNLGLPNPDVVDVTVRAADSVELTVVPATIRADTLTDTFTVTLVNPYSPVTVTPSSLEGTFTPTSVNLSVAAPSATFRGTFPNEGPAQIELLTSPSTPSGAPVDVTVLEQVVPELSLTAPVGVTYTGDQTGDFTVSLINGQTPVTITIVSETDTTSVSSFILTPESPNGTFTVAAGTAGTYNVSITNNAGITNPAAIPMAITADPAVLSFDAPAIVTGEAGVASDNFTVSATGLVRSVLVTPASTGTNTFTPTSVLLTPGAPSQTFTITSAEVGSKTISLSNNRSLTNPTPLDYEFTVATTPVITVTPNNGTSVQEDSAPISFTVSISNPDEETTITINSWGTSGLNTNTIVLSASNLSDDFTIAPTTPGSFNLTFTNNVGLDNPAQIPITVTAASVLSLSRTGSGDLTRDEEATFTVTLSNPPVGDVEITPYSDVGVIIGGYTPPMILNSGNLSDTFTVKSDTPDSYTVGITNDSAITNPSTVNIQVINGSLSLATPGAGLEAGVESQDFTITLNDYDFPTIVTIGITNFSDGTLTIDPTVSYSVTQMLLSSTNRSGTFTVLKPTSGQISITLTNNKALVNPTVSYVDFFDDPILAVLNPLVTRDLINQEIGDFNVECLSVDLAATDKLHADPHKDKVVLYLMFGDPVGTTITDSSPLTNIVEVFGGAQISSINPIYGDRVCSSPNQNGDYLRVVNVDDNFNFAGDFTFEIDLVRAGFGEENLIERYHPTNTNNFIFGFDGSNKLKWNNNGNVLTCSSTITSSTGLVKIAVSRIGSDLRVFVNGKLDGEYTNSTDYTADPVLVPALGLLGRVNSRADTQDFTGRVGKIKITNGVGRYSSNYVPESINPNSNVTVFPVHDKLGLDQYKDNVTLFLDFGQNSFEDFSITNKKVVIVVSATLTTVDPIHGLASALFDGNNDYLYISNGLEDFHFPGDFTIEVDFISQNINEILVDLFKTDIEGFYQLWINGTGKLEWQSIDNGVIQRYESISAINTNQPMRVAVSRISGVLRLFVNGIKETEVLDSKNYSPLIADIPFFGIGAQVTQRNTPEDFTGRMGKVKITKGVGRFSADYVPESLALLTITPPKLELTPAQPASTFSVASTNPGTYSIGFVNYDSVTNSSNRTVVFERLPTIQLTGGSLNLLKDYPSPEFTLSLLEATVPVEITFSFTTGINFDTPPTGLNSGKVVLDENTPTKTFTLITTDIGSLTFSLSNNKNLNNPSPLSLISTYLTVLNTIQPTVNHVFLNTTIQNARISIVDPNEPTNVFSYVDNMVDDIHAENVSLLLDFNGELESRVINDISYKNKPVSMGANGIKLVQHPLNPNQVIGAYENNSNSFFYVRGSDEGANLSDFIFGTGDFTIEMELLVEDLNINSCIMEFRVSLNGWWIYFSSDGTVRWTNQSGYICTTTTPINDFKDRFLTVTRVSGQLYMFIDGVLEGTVADPTNYSASPNYLAIGNQTNYNANGLYGTGYINYIRITKGVGRYTSNHTPYRVKKLKTTPHTFVLNTNGEYRDLTFYPYIPGNFLVKFKNNKNILDPNPLNLIFEKVPTINILSPSSKVSNVNENSGNYRVSLIDSSPLPVKITISLQSGLEFSTDPTNLTAVNEITLDSTNSYSDFTLTSSVAGSYSITLTNNTSLDNPVVQFHSFIVEGSDPLFLNENDLKLNLNKPEDTRYDLDLFQTII